MEPPVRRISPWNASLALLLAAILIWLIRSILVPFVLAAGIAYAAHPLVAALARCLHIRRWHAAITVFAVFVFCLAVAGWLAFPAIKHSVAAFGGDIEGPFADAIKGVIGDRTIAFFGEKMNAEEIANKTAAAARVYISTNIGTIASAGFAAITGGILTLVLLFYFLVSGPAIGRGLIDLVPPKQRPGVAHLWSRINPVLTRYFIGLGVIVIYASTAAYIGIGLALGLPYAIPLAAVSGFLEPVPVAGPLISAVLVGLVAVISAKSTAAIVGYIVYAVALRLSIDQIIAPVVLGNAVRVHPVLVIFSFLAGAVLFGIVGVILAMPAVVVAKIVLAELYGEPVLGADDQKWRKRERWEN